MHINIAEELWYIELPCTFEWKNRHVEKFGERSGEG